MKTAIHTPTQEREDKVVERFEEEGYEKSEFFRGSGKFLDIDREDICFDIESGEIEQADKTYYEDAGYKIISAEEYLGEWKQGDPDDRY